MLKADTSELYRHVEFLTSLQPARNYSNISSLNRAAEYIYTELHRNGYEVSYQPYKVHSLEYKNVIASTGPAGAERIIIGAHYDVDGEQPGADDNASGVAGLLEIARLIKENDLQLPYRLELVGFTLEESPFFRGENMGSAVHARSLKEANVPVKSMICLEMIGYFSDEPYSQQFPDPEIAKRYPHTGNYIVVVGKTGQEKFSQQMAQLMKKQNSVAVEHISLPEEHPLAGLSDHRNYWKHGYDAIMLVDSSFLRNPHYHQKSDTIDTLDFKRMAGVVDGVMEILKDFNS